jgi:hypothetical protein
MRLVRYIPNACDRAREWSSLALDGELSGFEQALLDAHLGRCAECRAFTEGVGETTELLRASEPARPSNPIRIPSRARPHVGVRRVFALAAAASIFVTAGLFGVMHSFAPGTQPLIRRDAAPRPALRINADIFQQRTARRAQLVAIIQLRTAGPGGPQLPGFLTS